MRRANLDRVRILAALDAKLDDPCISAEHWNALNWLRDKIAERIRPLC